jgi:hypothetical protein
MRITYASLWRYLYFLKLSLSGAGKGEVGRDYEPGE